MDPGVLEILCEETGLVGVCIILLGLWKEKKDNTCIKEHVQSPSDERQPSLPLGQAESYSFLKRSIANSIIFCSIQHAEVMYNSTNMPISSEYQ